jgi:hypothetical protein
MVWIGKIKKTSERLTFRTWKDKYCRDGVYPVIYLFPPNKYPNFTVIFEDYDKENEVRREVKIHIEAQRFKEGLRALGITLKKGDLPTLNFVVKGNDYGIEIDNDLEHILAWRGNYWFKVSIKDLPLDADEVI